MIYDIERSQIIAGGILTPEEITTGIIPKPEIAAGAKKPTAPLKPPSTGGGGGSKPYKKQYKYMLSDKCAAHIDFPFTYDNTYNTVVYLNSGKNANVEASYKVMIFGNNGIGVTNTCTASYVLRPKITEGIYEIAQGSKVSGSPDQICYFDLTGSKLKYGIKDVSNYSLTYSGVDISFTSIELFGSKNNDLAKQIQFTGAIIKKDDEIKYNLIPVQDLNGVDCWFDTINNEFYYPTGNGYFQGTDELIY